MLCLAPLLFGTSTHQPSQTDLFSRSLSPCYIPRYGTTSGTLSFDTDFFDLVRNNQVQIHREDITRLSPGTIHLSNGKALPTDALVAATGFFSTPSLTFSPASLHADLGVPTHALTRQQRATWTKLDRQADRLIAAQCPRLLPSPALPRTSPYFKPKHHNDDDGNHDIEDDDHNGRSHTPWRLYRGIAPPGLAAQGDRSLVFLGMCSNISNTTRLELQCLWALAYLTGHLDAQIPRDGDSDDNKQKEQKVLQETALWQRYTQHRAPYGHGRSYPDLVFDQLPYWDMLLADLGLATRRKGGWRELFAPYTHEDYRGIVDEWIRKTRP